MAKFYFWLIEWGNAVQKEQQENCKVIRGRRNCVGFVQDTKMQWFVICK